MEHRSKTLRQTLAGAVESRRAALRGGRSHRKDQHAVNAAIGRIETFLRGYPVASDERVRDWCRKNIGDVSMVVPGNQPTTLARLVMSELSKRSNTTSAA